MSGQQKFEESLANSELYRSNIAQLSQPLRQSALQTQTPAFPVSSLPLSPQQMATMTQYPKKSQTVKSELQQLEDEALRLRQSIDSLESQHLEMLGGLESVSKLLSSVTSPPK
eukprot:TRINITY_DN38808_c0_g1_i1.p1 TRINITY_DN38808_c0_g1~~TRINITY_DN38808_c0_g1_i1.p1  ORF type:complete len:113 (-),score=23.86 TRINITY_DN38808_c0_g1_i1:213-551(-)